MDFFRPLQIFVLLILLTQKYGNCLGSSGFTVFNEHIDTGTIITTEGKHIELICKSITLPDGNLTWYRNGTKIDGLRFWTIANGNLRIANVSLHDTGEYTCFTENKYLKKEKKTELIVKMKTQVREEGEDHHLVIENGKSAKICFDVVIDPTLIPHIRWFREPGGEIAYNDRFESVSDYCIEIRNATVFDSGFYTCHIALYVDKYFRAIDKFSIMKKLIVKDVPNAPRIFLLRCYENTPEMYATFWWESQGDNFAPIINYTVQYTSLHLDTWITINDRFSQTDNMYVNMAIRPGTLYAFQVIAFNEMGASPPSGENEYNTACQTSPDVPHRNPTDIKIKGTTPSNVVISWTPMQVSEHNGKGFHYYIKWKRNDSSVVKWNETRIREWYQDQFIIEGQPTFVSYVAIVMAYNRVGDSSETAIEHYGFSGEGHPTKAINDLTLVETSGTWAILRWHPLPRETLMGHFKEYTIHIWNNHNGKDYQRCISVNDFDATEVSVTDLRSNATNFIQIFVCNGKYQGPGSNIIVIETDPLHRYGLQSFQAFLLGAGALLLRWVKPLNDQVLAYKIAYREMNEKAIQPIEREIFIENRNVTQTKVVGLKFNTKYRFYIETVNGARSIERQIVEVQTKGEVGSVQPDPPTFEWEYVKVDDGNGNVSIKVSWMPAVDGGIGSKFFVKYRIKSESIWILTHHEEVDDFVIIRQLLPSQFYEMVMVSVDGEFTAESHIREIQTKENDSETAHSIPILNIALASAALILLLICIGLRIYFKMNKIQKASQNSTSSESTEEPTESQ